MNALEKIEFLKKEKEEDARTGYRSPYLIDIRYRKSKWSPAEIKTLCKKYPWLPEYYIEFLKRYDSLGLSWFRFFGSEETNINPLKEQLKYWKKQMGDRYFIFGDSIGGDRFVFNHQGEVWMIEHEDFDWEHPEKIANSLEEFIGDYLLGKKYAELDSIEKNTFYDFLKLQGWVD